MAAARRPQVVQKITMGHVLLWVAKLGNLSPDLSLAVKLGASRTWIPSMGFVSFVPWMRQAGNGRPFLVHHWRRRALFCCLERLHELFLTEVNRWLRMAMRFS